MQISSLKTSTPKATIRLVRFAAALAVGIVSSLFLLQLNASRVEIQRLEEANLLDIYSTNLSKELDRAFVSVQVLAVLAEENDASPDRFARLASALYNQLSGVLSLQLSPDGIVTFLYPDDRASGQIGSNLLENPLTAESAQQAVSSRAMVVDGPRALRQGGLGIVVRLPIFQNGEFWGFSTAVFRLGTLISRVGFDDLAARGYVYDIWVKLADGTFETVTDSGLSIDDRYLQTTTLTVANQQWTLGLRSSTHIPFSQISAVEFFIALLLVWLVSELSVTAFQLYLHRNHLNKLVDDQTWDLKQRELNLNQAQRVANVGSWHMQPQAKVRTLSGQAVRILDLNSPVQDMDSLIDQLHPEDRKAYRSFIGSESRANRVIEYRIAGVDGDKWYREVMEYDEASEDYVGTIQDISDQKRSQKLIWKQANLDVLTGLPNNQYLRTLIQGRILQLNSEEHALVLVLLDIRHFKKVNDGLGKHAGDEFLRTVSGRITECFPDALYVGRYAGDVFGVVLLRPQHDLKLDTIGEMINDQFDEPVVLDNASRFVAFHIGIASWPMHAVTADELCRCADIALHAAKEPGSQSRTGVFSIQLLEDSKLQDELDVDLRVAIREGQIFMVYQPVVDAQSQQIYAVEALVRWKHPEKGMIGPDKFVASAERSGLIFSLGKAIIRLVSQDAHHFAEQGLGDIRININISRNQFMDDGFSAYLKEQLKTKFPQNQKITLEVTESYELTDYETLTKVINSLEHDDLQWSLDDFGTGYSSYSAIGLLPVDNIKIDRSFIMKLESSSVDQTIVANIISMAHTLNKTVTAEGVETEEQLQLLKQMSCDYLQGYFFSRPLTAEQLITLSEDKQILPTS